MWFWLSGSTFCFSTSTQQAGRSKHSIAEFWHAWDTGKESGFFISSTTRHYRMCSCLWCLLLIHYRFRNAEMVATCISNVRSWPEDKVVHWGNEDIDCRSSGQKPAEMWCLHIHSPFTVHLLPRLSGLSLCAAENFWFGFAFLCLPVTALSTNTLMFALY